MQKNTRITEFFIGKNGLIPCCGIGAFGLNEVDLLSLLNQYCYSNILVDTAAKYNNETDIASALKKCQIERENVFITSKISYAQQQSKSVRQALYESLNRLETTYLDLYLIHSPRYTNFVDIWVQLINLQDEGLIKYIGVSNFEEEQLNMLYEATKRWPDVNQIVLNLYSSDATKNLVSFCQNRDILVEAAMPFGGSENAEKCSSDNRNSILRSFFEQNIVSLPGTKNCAHMVENFATFFNGTCK